MPDTKALLCRLEALEALIEQTRREAQQLRAELLDAMRKEERARLVGPSEFKERQSNEG